MDSRISTQSAQSRNDLLARIASVCFLQLIAFYYLPALLVLSALSLFIAVELAGVSAARAIERRVTPAATASLLLTAVLGSIVFTTMPLALYGTGSAVAKAVAVLALATALVHCIIVRSTWLSYGLLTAAPMLAGQLYIYLDVLGQASDRVEALIGIAPLAVAALYVWRSVEEMNATRMRLLKATDEANAANRAKSRFLAAMSHEIRTPLYAICGISELLDADQDQSLHRERSKLLLKSARALNKIVDNILDHAKVESGTWELTLLNACLADEIHSVVQTFRLTAEEKDLWLTLSLAPDLPPLSSFDPLKVRQVLSNLLSNAAKYTERGGIEVKASTSELNDGWLMRVTVIDTGRGLTSGQIEGLFKDFSRTTGKADSAVEGTGLGLVISQEFARMMGGDITVDSAPAAGSAFHFTARLRPPREVDADRSGANGSIKGAKSPDAHPIASVLIVDDNATSRYLTKAFLKSSAEHIDEAENGNEALARISERPYEVVLMDMQMPVMNGQETLKALRDMGGRFSATPVIMLTASASLEERRDYVALGASGCLCKPVRKEELLAEIDRVVTAA